MYIAPPLKVIKTKQKKKYFVIHRDIQKRNHVNMWVKKLLSISDSRDVVMKRAKFSVMQFYF
jgi:hypothetical protein